MGVFKNWEPSYENWDISKPNGLSYHPAKTTIIKLAVSHYDKMNNWG